MIDTRQIIHVSETIYKDYGENWGIFHVYSLFIHAEMFFCIKLYYYIIFIVILPQQKENLKIILNISWNLLWFY